MVLLGVVWRWGGLGVPLYGHPMSYIVGALLIYMGPVSLSELVLWAFLTLWVTLSVDFAFYATTAGMCAGILLSLGSTHSCCYCVILRCLGTLSRCLVWE